jgi:hypothetical protein
MKSSVFWDITRCIPFKANRRFGGTCRPHLQGRRISRARNLWLCSKLAFALVCCSSYYSTLKMKVTCSSETSVDVQRTTRNYIPEYRTLLNHRFKNLKSLQFSILYTFVKNVSPEDGSHEPKHAVKCNKFDTKANYCFHCIINERCDVGPLRLYNKHNRMQNIKIHLVLAYLYRCRSVWKLSDDL